MKMSGLLGPIIIFIITSVFPGCGGGGGGSNGVASNVSEHHSITDCYGCHADGSIAKYADENIFSAWRDSSHGNYEGTDYAGNPAYSDLTTSGCNSCHDDRGDGELLENYYSTTGISFLGTVNRPLVGCESCHGSGDTHYGTGLMQYPAPDAAICGNCHKEDSYHAATNPAGNGIYEAYQSSPHAGPVSAEVYADGSTTDAKAKCSKCHTDEGARLYKDISGGYDVLEAAAYSTDPVADVNAVQCRTCHDVHNTNKLLKSAGAGTSAEYETCTSCHRNEDDSYHGKNNPEFSASDTTKIIYDSHSDDDTTSDIEGYIIDKSSSTACSDCHNPHGADNTINDEWANSAHGGHILETTQDPVTNKFTVTETEGVAWVHYDFKGSDRQACQRCHTATGFKNLVTSPSTYDPANNVFAAAGLQKEMLYCWACHTTNVGGLRDPGAFSSTGIPPYSVPADRIAAVPDINGSNLCMSCHSGRVSGDSLKSLDYATQISGKNFGNFNSHYLAAGGIMFRTVGYEYTGRDYSNDISYIHDMIGTTGGTDGDNGPCAGCHMRTDESHTFEVVEGDLGAVTDIKAYTNVCSGCHGNKATLISTLNTRDTQYNAALSALDTQLQSMGIYYCSSYPYFKTAAACGGGFYTAWPDADTLGAAFNYNLLKNIPAAYVHNREYTRKLIYDSIDFLDGGGLDKSVETTLGGSGSAYDYLNNTR